MFESPYHISGRGSSSNQAKATSTSPQLEPRKLRASCDNCYLSKVKCAKERPTCSRCSNHDVPCKYSPSQRVGKPKKSRDERSEHTASSVDSHLPSFPPSHSDSNASTHLLPFSWDFDLINTPLGPPISSGGELEGASSMPWQGPSILTENDQGPFQDSRSNSSCQFDPKASPVPVNSFSSYSFEGQPPITALRLMGETIREAQGNQSFLANKLPVQEPSISDSLSAMNREHCLSPCNCSNATIETLRTLHDVSENTKTTFDKVLATNKDVVGELSAILTCQCRKDSASILTLAVVIEKVLSWYQSIGRVSPSTAAADAVVPMPITLGVYRLDGGDGEQIKMQVVLSELLKMNQLMAQFKERFCTLPVEHDAARIHDELVTFLRQRLKGIVERLQRDLQTVYEGLNFLALPRQPYFASKSLPTPG